MIYMTILFVPGLLTLIRLFIIALYWYKIIEFCEYAYLYEIPTETNTKS